MTEQTRGWIYRGGALLIAVLILIDVTRGGDATHWIGVVAAAIGLGTAGLAARNTDTRAGQ